MSHQMPPNSQQSTQNNGNYYNRCPSQNQLSKIYVESSKANRTLSAHNSSNNESVQSQSKTQQSQIGYKDSRQRAQTPMNPYIKLSEIPYKQNELKFSLKQQNLDKQRDLTSSIPKGHTLDQAVVENYFNYNSTQIKKVTLREVNQQEDTSYAISNESMIAEDETSICQMVQQQKSQINQHRGKDKAFSPQMSSQVNRDSTLLQAQVLQIQCSTSPSQQPKTPEKSNERPYPQPNTIDSRKEYPQTNQAAENSNQGFNPQPNSLGHPTNNQKAQGSRKEYPQTHQAAENALTGVMYNAFRIHDNHLCHEIDIQKCFKYDDKKKCWEGKCLLCERKVQPSILLKSANPQHRECHETIMQQQCLELKEVLKQSVLQIGQKLSSSRNYLQKFALFECQNYFCDFYCISLRNAEQTRMVPQFCPLCSINSVFEVCERRN